jgi:hypothetical protein
MNTSNRASLHVKSVFTNDFQRWQCPPDHNLCTVLHSTVGVNTRATVSERPPSPLSPLPRGMRKEQHVHQVRFARTTNNQASRQGKECNVESQAHPPHKCCHHTRARSTEHRTVPMKCSKLWACMCANSVRSSSSTRLAVLNRVPNVPVPSVPIKGCRGSGVAGSVMG